MSEKDVKLLTVGKQVVALRNSKGYYPKYESVEQMDLIIDQYFLDIESDNSIMIEQYKSDIQNLLELGMKNPKLPLPNFRRPLITGLANALHLSRKQLVEYSNKDQYRNTIKRAKQRVEEYNENSLYSGTATAGVIFNLKNNFGWKDKTEVDNNLNVIQTASSLVEKVDDDDYGYLKQVEKEDE